VPQISTIIPTYNHRDYVRAAIQSALDQTLSDIEIIVINDGSTDDTAAVLRPLINSQKIRYFEQPNAGQAAARNRGLQEARGQYIAYLDDDDIWPAEKLAWQADVLDRGTDIGIIGGAVERFDESGQSLGVTANVGSITFESLFGANPMISPGQCLIRASLLRDLGGFDPKVWGADDWDLWFRATQKMRLVMDARVALQYRVHATNASRDLTRMLHNSLLVVDRHLPALPPEQRSIARRKAYRLLFDYLGSPIIRGIMPSVFRGDFRRATRSAALAKRFVVPAIKDPKLIAMGARDLLPLRLRRLASKIKNGFRSGAVAPEAAH